ncbi:MAG TPA: hypothetical protein VFC04_01845 [Actinomycetota bacterium]|nr:hypothetical protein [Actinomycetota bacterium]
MALSPRDRRALIILGVVAGLAIVAFVLIKVLGGGGGTTEAASPSPVATGSPSAAPSPGESPTPTPRETLPPVVLAGARDPFSIPPILQTATPTPSGSVSPTSAPSGSPSTSPPPTGSPSPSPTPTTPGGGQSTTIGGHTVVLDDIFAGGTKAQVEVDGTVYTVKEGETFDDNFKLVSISGSCARFLFGDQSFTLCLKPEK